jgi:uncharacterized membrane protein
MTWGNTVAALGTTIEIVGFVLLAIELRNANTNALVEAKTLQSLPRDAETIIVSDGPDGGIEMTGGRIGALLTSFNQRQVEHSRSKRLIFHGLIWAAVGLVIQLLGSILQVFNF